MGGRTADGSMYPDPVRFPSGMKYLANYIHSKVCRYGLSSGERNVGLVLAAIHIQCGVNTLGIIPGIIKHIKGLALHRC